MADTPLILFAGMGADERLFAPQREAFPQLVVPKWIEPVPGESLAEYARRFAEYVDPGVECYVGGASFGGFVALEVARHLTASDRQDPSRGAAAKSSPGREPGVQAKRAK
jgi:predicted esterase